MIRQIGQCACAAMLVWMAGCKSPEATTAPAPVDPAVQAAVDKIKKQSIELERQIDRHEFGADNAALNEIAFPADPSRENLRRYILEILDLDHGQMVFQCERRKEMLAKVGAGNVDLLLAVLPPYPSAAEFEVCEVVNSLSGDVNKAVILQNLPQYSYLLDAVRRNGWEKDAKPVLLETINSGRQVSPAIIAAIAGMRDPSTYPALIGCMIRNPDRYGTYRRIKNLPGIKISAEDIAAAWKNQRNAAVGDPDTVAFATVAAGVGEADALAVLVRAVKSGSSPATAKMLTVFYTYTDLRGAPEVVISQYEQMKEQLYWDRAAGKYKMKIGGEARHE